MLSKNEVKDIQSLRQKKFRDEYKRFVAEGSKIICELLLVAPHQFNKVYGTEDWVKENQHLLQNISYEIISEEELSKISQQQTPNKVVGVVRFFEHREASSENEFYLYLNAIQDPGNFGTIIRIADWFGIKNIVCSEGCADVYNTKVVQSTMASIARVNVFYDLDFAWLKKQRLAKYAAVLGGNNLYEEPPLEAGILIIGNESRGIQESILQLATKKITIPKKGAAESLNAAVATGIILSHLLK